MTALWTGIYGDYGDGDGDGRGDGAKDGDGYSSGGYGDGYGNGDYVDVRDGYGHGSRYGYPEKDVCGCHVAISKIKVEYPTLPVIELTTLAVTS